MASTSPVASPAVWIMAGGLGAAGCAIFGIAAAALSMLGPSRGNLLDGTLSYPFLFVIGPLGAIAGAAGGVRLADKLCARDPSAWWIYALDGVACAVCATGGVIATTMSASTPWQFTFIVTAAAGAAGAAVMHALLS